MKRVREQTVSSILRNEGVVTRRIRRRKRSERRRRREEASNDASRRRNATRRDARHSVGMEGKEGGREEKRRWTLA